MNDEGARDKSRDKGGICRGKKGGAGSSRDKAGGDWDKAGTTSVWKGKGERRKIQALQGRFRDQQSQEGRRKIEGRGDQG